MKDTNSKIKATLDDKRIKLHVFEPSNRKIWTVVGTEQEYWIDPDLEFCSCAGFYFSKLNDKKGCYHLESFQIAIKNKQYETITFSDEEFDDFISSLIIEF